MLCFYSKTVVRFLTWTLRNVFYVRFGKRYVRLWHSLRSRTVIWGGLRWDGSWKRPAGAGTMPTAAAAAGNTDMPPAHKPNPNLKQRPLRALFCLKLDSSCCYAHYSCGNNCTVVIKVVQECKFFWRILLAFYGNSLPRTIRYLGKRTVTIERSR